MLALMIAHDAPRSAVRRVDINQDSSRGVKVSGSKGTLTDFEALSTRASSAATRVIGSQALPESPAARAATSDRHC